MGNGKLYFYFGLVTSPLVSGSSETETTKWDKERGSTRDEMLFKTCWEWSREERQR